jgi:hypothetical protein
MDKNLDNQTFSVEILFQALQKGVEVFDLSFWREILSQVLLPILEDIDIAFENQQQKNKNERTFLLNTILLMLDKFNRFVDRNIKKLGSVIPSYLDILLMFLAQTTAPRIIEILVRCIRPFVTSIAGQLGKADWDQIIDSIALCFEATSPVDLLEKAK